MRSTAQLVNRSLGSTLLLNPIAWNQQKNVTSGRYTMKYRHFLLVPKLPTCAPERDTHSIDLMETFQQIQTVQSWIMLHIHNPCISLQVLYDCLCLLILRTQEEGPVFSVLVKEVTTRPLAPVSVLLKPSVVEFANGDNGKLLGCSLSSETTARCNVMRREPSMAAGWNSGCFSSTTR